MWLLREMIRNGVNNVDNLCWNVLRHAAGGDISPRNILLVENLLDIFLENRLVKYNVPQIEFCKIYFKLAHQ